MNHFTESPIKQAVPDKTQALDWQITFALDIALDGPLPKRKAATNHSNVVLTRRPCLPDVEKVLEEV